MLGAHGGEVIAERGDKAERQHRDSILPALAVANEDLAALEVEVLHAELGAFKQTEAGAVQEGGQKERDAGHAIQESAHLGLREHRGQTCGALRSGEIDVLREGEREDVGIEKRMAARAWFWVEALTCWSVARCVRNASTWARPRSRGWRRSWKRMKRRIQAQYASSVRGL
ncbi:hypothetical protein WME81_41910 [Sorangium sp. So ce1078]